VTVKILKAPLSGFVWHKARFSEETLKMKISEAQQRTSEENKEKQLFASARII
jgi:hypothetical protein